MSRRASLPGAEELFRRTSSAGRQAAEERKEKEQEAPSRQEDKSTKLQVATPAPDAKKAPKHQEKVTFYCTPDDLLALERARLRLRSEHGVAADRGRMVRAALAYVVEDFEARGEDSVLLRQLSE